MKFLKYASILAGALASCCLFGQAQPGWHNDTQSRNFSAAVSILNGTPEEDGERKTLNVEAPAPLMVQSMSLLEEEETPIGNDADTITPEIKELARGLLHDPVKIFEYCYNNIKYEHYFGSKKGATLTLLEGSGNGFDTAALMVALLRESGYTASYRYGPLDLFDSEVANWLGLWFFGDDSEPFPQWTDAEFRANTGTTNDARDTLTLRYLFNNILYYLDRGFPAVQPDYWGYYWYVPHVWVQFIDLDGVTHEVDPSFKTLLPASSAVDVETASGYNRGTVLADVAAGATITSNYVKNLDEAALASRLTAYTTALSTWLKGNRPNSTVDALIGRRKYARNGFSELSDIPTVYYGSNVSYLPVKTWDEIPETWMTKLTVTAGEYNYATKAFTTTRYTTEVNMPFLQGRKFSLDFSGAGGSTGTLYLDENLLKTGSTFSIPNADIDIQISINHPHGTYNQTSGVWSDDGAHDQSEVKAYLKGDDYAYTFLYGFRPSGRLLRKRQEVLDAYLRDTSIANDSHEVVSEMLNIMGLNWLLQTRLSDEIIAGQYNANDLKHHSFGRMGQEEGYYVDVGLGFSGVKGYDGSSAQTAFSLQTHFASALEHSLIEQMQGQDKSAASTIKILQLANDQGQRVYRADPSNWTTTVRSHLASKGYTAFTLDGIEDYINNKNGIVLLPEEPNVILDDWKGTGYAVISDSDTVFAGMIISGGYFGGYLSTSDTVDYEPLYDFAYSDPSYFDTISGGLIYASDPVTTPAYYGADPVDMASGAFVYNKTDLQLGQGAPRGLAFSRQYNSNRRYDDSNGLGYGWTHNLNIRVYERSSIKAGLGESTQFQMAPYLAALAVAKDLYSETASVHEWQTACLAIKWASDQLLYKAVSITMGSQNLEFVEMPDGSYAAPAGITITLHEENLPEAPTR